MKGVLRCVRDDDGDACERRYLVEGIVDATLSSPTCSGGNPIFGSPGSDNGDTIGAVLPLGGIVLEHMLAGGICRWSGVASTTLTLVSLYSMVQRGLDDGHAQGGGAICRRGGVDGRPGKGLSFDQ